MPDLLTLPDPKNPHVRPAKGGWYANVLDFHYHQWEAVSQSALKVFERSPAHYRAYVDFPPEFVAQKQANLDLGSAFDMATLQPDEFSKWFRLRPEGNANSNAYKDEVAAIKAENPFIRLLKPDAWDKVHRMRDAVLSHPLAGGLLGASPQLSGLRYDEDRGIWVKIRLDDHAPGIALVDLKKTGDARKEAFGKIAHNLRYVRQGALYLNEAAELGIHEKEFFFVVCEDERPHGVMVYRIISSHLAQAEAELEALLDRFAKCTRENEWPSYPADPDDLWLPPWAERSFEETVEAVEEAA